MLNNTHRGAFFRPYPGVFSRLLVGFAGYGAYLLGFRLPLHVASWLQWLAELLVFFLIWKGLRSLLAARKRPLRLFKAQDMFTFAVIVQALVLLLPG